MDESRRQRSRGPRTRRGRALFDLVVEITHTFFRMRAVGARIGAVASGGGGVWGVLRILVEEGPRTVPEMARARGVARQHIQALVNDLAARGLVELIENPAHRRSRLVRVTAAGEERFRALTAELEALADRLAADMDEEKLRTAGDVLAQLREKLARL